MTDWTSLTYVVVDVEGNGQQPPDLVELAVVPIIGGVIGEPVSWLVRPDAPITHFARKEAYSAILIGGVSPQLNRGLTRSTQLS